MNTEWYVEIDGEPHKVDGVYENGIGNGVFYGANEKTKPGDEVRRSFPDGACVAFVSAYWKTPESGVEGVEGVYKNGMWGTHPGDDLPVFKVSERIA